MKQAKISFCDSLLVCLHPELQSLQTKEPKMNYLHFSSKSLKLLPFLVIVLDKL